MISFRWLTDHLIISSWSGSSVDTNQTLLRQFFHCFWSSFRNLKFFLRSSRVGSIATCVSLLRPSPQNNFRHTADAFQAVCCWWIKCSLWIWHFVSNVSLVLLSAWLQSDQFIVSSCLLAPADQGRCVILHPFDCFWFSKSAAGCSDYFHFNDFLVVVVMVFLLLDLQFWRHNDFILQPLDGCIHVPMK